MTTNRIDVLNLIACLCWNSVSKNVKGICDGKAGERSLNEEEKEDLSDMLIFEGNLQSG